MLRLLTFILCIVSTVAFAQKPKATLQSEVNAMFPDQFTGAIAPSVARSVFGDFINSWQQYTGVNAQVGASYTIQASDYGQLITFNNSSPIAVTIPAANGTFSTFNTLVSNVGTGTVTITPAGGTINGGANYTLSNGQGAWIISDGTNYQIWINSTLSLPAGISQNVLHTVTSNYPIAASDCGKTIQAGTGTTGYFTVTLPSISGFATTCSVTVKNGDTGRAKLLSGFPADLISNRLEPLQVVTVGIVNGAWATLVNPGKWQLPASQNIYIDVTSGKDDGTTDGFATGSAFKSGTYA